MNRFLIFAGKEIKETLRTKRFIVLIIAFLFFAVTGPLLARYLTEFVGMFTPGDDAMAAALLGLPEPTWQDSYFMYYSNMIQMGILALVLMFMGVIFDEKRRGTAALMMMKGITHTTFVLAKFAIIALVTFVVIAIATMVAHFYTYILFEEAAVLGDVLMGGLSFWAFALFMSAIAMFFSTISKSMAMSAVLSIVAFFTLIIIDLVDRVGDVVPYVLSRRATEMTVGIYDDLVLTNFITVIFVIAALLAASIAILRKQEI